MGLALQAQVNVWHPATISDLPASRNTEDRYTTPDHFALLQMELADLRAELESVPHENQITRRNSYAQFEFPMPDGSFRTFRIVEYKMIEDGLARKFPHMKFYTGIDTDNGAKIHFNLTKDQFFASIREKGQTYFIDPYFRTEGDFYITYNISDDKHEDLRFSCEQHELVDGEIEDVDSTPDDQFSSDKKMEKRGAPFTLRTYRLAVSATFGFTDYYGGTTQGALDGIATIINRVNAVYERDVAVRMILVANNDQLVFTTQGDDPFNGIGIGDQEAMVSQNQTTITNIIGFENYDIGHVFATNANSPFGQGFAPGRTCLNNQKARAWSARGVPLGDAFSISLVCHEMGHQFSATHTMYHCHNVQLNSPNSTYEPGSGSTIMSYAGICPNGTNIINNSDDYFHTNSIEQIIEYSRENGGSSCGEDIDFGNTYPDIVLDYPSTIYIPVSTPFKLTGAGLDAETPGNLTYCWEQFQTGIRNFDNNAWDLSQPVGNEPLFRSRPPVAEGTRYFPLLPIVVNNSDYIFEQLPDYARDLKFRLTVRDNASENGGAAWEEVDIDVIDNSAAGKFEITNFNVKDTIKTGSLVEVTWDVAETDLNPINTKFVNIYLSIDGGTSFPHLLISHTPNDGSAFVNIPNLTADRFRFMVEAEDNIYYDVTDRSGLLCVDSSKLAVGVSYDDLKYEVCAPDVIEIDIQTYGLGGFSDTVDLAFTGNLPAGATTEFTLDRAPVGIPVTLTVDLSEVSTGGEYSIAFAVSNDSIETVERSLELAITTNNFDNLTLIQPVNGSTGNDFVPTLEWNTVNDALDYTVELSDDAQFSNIIYTEDRISGNQTTIDIQLDAGGVYFWRVLPRNACDLHNINRVSAFQVKDLSCDEYCSNLPSITLPASGTSAAEMVINTGASTTVNDLNITSVMGRHSDIGQVVLTIEGPDGTQVEVFSRGICEFTNTNMDMGFDDDAAGVFPTCLDFDEGIRYEPSNPLSALNGQSGSEYKLIMADVVSGSGGRFDGWCFEICGDVVPEKPILVNADSIHMEINGTRTISTDKLEVTHTQYIASELTITIVEIPTGGELLLEGVPLTYGSQLTMQDVLDNKLSYTHLIDEPILDHFSFVTTDPGNGFLGTPSIPIYVGISSTSRPLPAGSILTLFPNPVSDILNLKLESDKYLVNGAAVYSVDGRLVNRLTDLNTTQLEIETQQLPKGIYLIQVQAGPYVEIRKFVKQ